MTYKKLQEIFSAHNIPENVLLYSDSGWECGATNINGIYYNKAANVIIFTQTSSKYCKYDPANDGPDKILGFEALN